MGLIHIHNGVMRSTLFGRQCLDWQLEERIFFKVGLRIAKLSFAYSMILNFSLYAVRAVTWYWAPRTHQNPHTWNIRIISHDTVHHPTSNQNCPCLLRCQIYFLCFPLSLFPFPFSPSLFSFFFFDCQLENHLDKSMMIYICISTEWSFTHTSGINFHMFPQKCWLPEPSLVTCFTRGIHAMVSMGWMWEKKNMGLMVYDGDKEVIRFFLCLAYRSIESYTSKGSGYCSKELLPCNVHE